MVNYYCTQCKNIYCIKCNQKGHPGKKCGLKEIIQNLKEANEMLDEHGKPMKTVACPHCLVPCQKADENCDHVKCGSCNKDFNFCCGSKRAPCLEHGKHYHRPACHFLNDDDK
jgi:hypothetical protein